MFSRNHPRMLQAAAIGLALAASLAFLPGKARADYVITLSVSNSPSTLGSGPYGTVTIHEISSTDVVITFQANAGYGFVDGGSMGINVANTADTFSNLTSNGESLTLAHPLPTNEDGFGKFNEVWDQNDSSNPATTMSVEITGTGFSVTNTSQNVLALNDATHQALAAAHIIFLTDGKGSTGFAAGGPSGGPGPQDTPVPSSAILLGLGGLSLVGFVGLRRRRKAAVAA